jgi:hypothetical protein
MLAMLLYVLARAFDYLRGCRIGEASNPGPDANRPKGKQPARTRAPDALETASEDAVNARQHKATYPPQPKQFAHKGGKVTTRGGLPAEAIEAGKRLRRLEYAVDELYAKDEQVIQDLKQRRHRSGARAPTPEWCKESAADAGCQDASPVVQWHDAPTKLAAVEDAGLGDDENCDGYDTGVEEPPEQLPDAPEGSEAVADAWMADDEDSDEEPEGMVAHAPQGGHGGAGHQHADDGEENGIGTGPNTGDLLVRPDNWKVGAVAARLERHRARKAGESIGGVESHDPREDIQERDGEWVARATEMRPGKIYSRCGLCAKLIAGGADMVTMQPPAEGLTAAEKRRWATSGYSWSQRPVWGSNEEELPTQNLHTQCAQRALQDESGSMVRTHTPNQGRPRPVPANEHDAKSGRRVEEPGQCRKARDANTDERNAEG